MSWRVESDRLAWLMRILDFEYTFYHWITPQRKKSSKEQSVVISIPPLRRQITSKWSMVSLNFWRQQSTKLNILAYPRNQGFVFCQSSHLTFRSIYTLTKFSFLVSMLIVAFLFWIVHVVDVTEHISQSTNGTAET